jgi:hypothetical protein
MREETTAWLPWLAVLVPLSSLLAGTASADPLPGYSTYRTFTVAAGKVAGTHIDEVVGFFVDPADYPEAMPGGTDLRFTNTAGVLLDHELVRWEGSDGILYFKADVLANESQFLVHYGNPDATSVPPVGSTWSKWAAVYHFEEDPTTHNRLTDSSGNGIHGVLSAQSGFEWSAETRVPGAVGYGWDYETQRVTTLPDIDMTGSWTTFVIHKNTENKNQNTGLFTYHNRGFYWDMAGRGDITIKTLEQTEPGFWLRGTNISGPVNDGTDFVYLALRHAPGVDGGVEFFSNGSLQNTSWAIMDGNPWTPLGVPVNANLDLVGTGKGSSTPFGLSSAAWHDNASDGNNGISDEQWIYDGLADDDYIALLHKNLSDNASFWSVSQAITVPVTDAPSSGRAAALGAAHPNPFNPSTTISYSLSQAGNAQLIVYDLAGHRVKTLVSGHVDGGRHEARWDGRNDQGRRVASGVYLYRLVTGGFSETRRMVLLK